MWRAWIMVGAVCWLAGCGGEVLPGEGTLPSELYLDVGLGKSGSFSISECTAAQAAAILVFTGGSTTTGNFTNRVVWRSNNPETLYVADGSTPYSNGVVYPAGALLAVRPGAAQLTATYMDFTATAAVEVRALDSLRIEPQLTDLAENLEQQYQLYVRYAEGQPEQLATTSALWSFPRSTAAAAVGAGTGLVTTNSASSEPLEISAQLPGCAREVRTQFRVSTVKSLELGYEQGSELRLPVGYGEALTVNARFAAAGSTLQNVGSFVEIDGLDDDLLSVVRGTEALYVQAVDTSDRSAGTGFTLTLKSANLTVQSKLWTPVETDLLRFTVSPVDLRLQYPSTGLLSATGSFADGVQRPITRHVGWASNASTLVVGSGIGDSAGELYTEDIDATAEVTATLSSAKDDTEDSVRVRTYASTSTLPQ